MHYGPFFWGGWGLVMMLGMLVFWGVLIAGLVLLIRYLAMQSPRPSGGETPVDILNRRLAAGQITPEEYDAVGRKIKRTDGEP